MRKSRSREAGQLVRSHILRQSQGLAGIPRVSLAHMEASSVNAGWLNKNVNMLTFNQETFKSHVSEWICSLYMHASEECFPVFRYAAFWIALWEFSITIHPVLKMWTCQFFTLICWHQILLVHLQTCPSSLLSLQYCLPFLSVGFTATALSLKSPCHPPA